MNPKFGGRFRKADFSPTPFEQRVAKLVKPHMVCLEIGPGVGRLVDTLCRHGALVHAIDPDAAVLDHIRKRRGMGTAIRDGRFHFIHGKVPEALSQIADHSLDLVAAQSSLHYLDWSERTTRLWPELRRVLKPGGILALSLKGIDNWWLRIADSAPEVVNQSEMRLNCPDSVTRSFFTVHGLRKELKPFFNAKRSEIQPRLVFDYERVLDDSVFIECFTQPNDLIPLLPPRSDHRPQSSTVSFSTH